MRAANFIAGLGIGLGLVLAAPAALACGHCVEDKIASVYDHAVVTGALANRHQVAFFAIDGVLAADAGTRRAIEKLAAGARGVDAGSTRVSAETASLSVAFDPARTSFASLQGALDRRLALRGLSLLPLRVMDKPAELKAVSSR